VTRQLLTRTEAPQTRVLGLLSKQAKVEKRKKNKKKKKKKGRKRDIESLKE